MATAKKSANKHAGNKGSPCWPGFEPVPGKAPMTKGSCKPQPGKHSAATKRASRRAAAAAKLETENKPHAKTE